MSVRVGGVFVLIPNMSVSENISLSFSLGKYALDSHIGLHQGGNARFQHSNHPEEINENTIPFDITDDPLDINADCLFGGDGIKMYVANNRVDDGETLTARLLRVQSFLNKVLSTDKVVKIVLNVNLEKDEEYDLKNINADSFREQMQELYEKNDNWTPTIKLIIE